MRKVCRFQFEEGGSRQAIEAELTLAITVAECLFGRAQVRLGTGYLFSEDGRELVLDISGETGEYVARIFTGLLIRNVGERCFRVEAAARS